MEKRQKQLFFDGCSEACTMKEPAGDAALTIKLEVPAGKKKVVLGQLLRSMYFVDPHMLRLERP